MDWEKVRKQFPALEKYIYLNAGGGSPMSQAAAMAANRYYDEMLQDGDNPYEDWLLRTEDTRRKVAVLINAEPEEIGFVVNTSTGMNIISQMLKGQGRVVSMNDEFPSSTIPWLNAGYEVKLVVPVNYSYPIGLLAKNIPGCKILVTSYVQYCTGFRQDLKEVGELCRKNELISLLF